MKPIFAQDAILIVDLEDRETLLQKRPLFHRDAIHSISILVEIMSRERYQHSVYHWCKAAQARSILSGDGGEILLTWKSFSRKTLGVEAVSIRWTDTSPLYTPMHGLCFVDDQILVSHFWHHEKVREQNQYPKWRRVWANLMTMQQTNQLSPHSKSIVEPAMPLKAHQFVGPV